MEKSLFFPSVNGDRKYDWNDWAEYFASFIGNGVFPSPADGLQVVAGGGMTVKIKVGKAWMNGRYYRLMDEETAEIHAASATQSRVDRISLRYVLSKRQITPYLILGNTGSTTNTTLRRDDDMYDLVLADIMVPAGASEITDANITDRRLDGSLCGLVTGVIDQIDATGLFTQFTAAWNEWFTGVQNALDGDTAGHLYNLINGLTASDIATSDSGKSVQDRLDELENGSGGDWVPLWENASPTSGFDAQTLTMDLSGYSAIKIIYSPSVGSSHAGLWVTELAVGDDTVLNGCYYYLVERAVEVTASGIIFGAGRRYEGTYGSSTTTTYTSGCAPIRIMGKE